MLCAYQPSKSPCAPDILISPLYSSQDVEKKFRMASEMLTHSITSSSKIFLSSGDPNSEVSCMLGQCSTIDLHILATLYSFADYPSSMKGNIFLSGSKVRAHTISICSSPSLILQLHHLSCSFPTRESQKTNISHLLHHLCLGPSSYCFHGD